MLPLRWDDARSSATYYPFLLLLQYLAATRYDLEMKPLATSIRML